MQSSGFDGVEASRDESGSLSQSHEEPSSHQSQPEPDSSHAASSNNTQLLTATITATTTPTTTDMTTNTMVHPAASVSAAPSKSHTPTLEDAPLSHATTPSNSNSSHLSTKDAIAIAQAQAATHYGTRSRNRPSRPNYAEDVEMDFEQAVYTDHNQAAVTATPAAASAAASPQTSPGASVPAKRAAATSNGWASVNSNSSVIIRGIPGTSTFSANPHATVSKKRKAASNVSSGSQGNLVHAAQTQALSKRANSLAGAREVRETNMYTFENTKARLQKGKLVADNGTEFCVNGK
jgi:hypothetical protein